MDRARNPIMRSSSTDSPAAAALGPAATAPALAHHGFGLFQMDKFTDYSGTLTKLELVNPHSLSVLLETVDADGKPLSDALRDARGHADQALGLEDGGVRAGPARRRPRLIRTATIRTRAISRASRSAARRRSTATINSRIDARRHVEAAAASLLRVSRTSRAIGPSSRPCSRFRRAAAAARSCRGACARTSRPARSRSSRFAHATPRHRAAPTRRRGQAAATAFRMWSPEDNPRLVVQAHEHRVRLDVRLAGQPHHADDRRRREGHRHRLRPRSAPRAESISARTSTRPNLSPSNSGPLDRPLGRTTRSSSTPSGFAEGVLVPPTRNSAAAARRRALHARREDVRAASASTRRKIPSISRRRTQSSDTVLLSETPFEKQPCSELTFEFTQPGNWMSS